MGVLRWRSRLDEAIAAASARPLAKLDPEVLTALRLAAYQLQHLTRVPAHAAINDSVELMKRAHKRSAAPFGNAVLRKIAAAKIEPPPESPDWTAALLARRICSSAMAGGALGGRVRHRTRPSDLPPRPANTKRGDPRRRSRPLEQELEAEGVKLDRGALLAGARIVTGGEITRTRAFQEGRVFILDEASQLVAALVGTGSRLLDCCAAPGGKTQALAARNPSAEIIAAELHPHRAELLRSRVHAANVQVIQADALDLPTAGGFDRVLADVPCSGTGTLARNPEIKWRLKPDDLDDLHQRQVAILRAALGQLAPGGRALYSTCSLEREENEAVIEEVLHGSSEFELRDCREELERLRSTGELVWSDVDSLLSGKFLRTIPGVQPCDGFFAAMVERSG